MDLMHHQSFGCSVGYDKDLLSWDESGGFGGGNGRNFDESGGFGAKNGQNLDFSAELA